MSEACEGTGKCKSEVGINSDGAIKAEEIPPSSATSAFTLLFPISFSPTDYPYSVILPHSPHHPRPHFDHWLGRTAQSPTRIDLPALIVTRMPGCFDHGRRRVFAIPELPTLSRTASPPLQQRALAVTSHPPPPPTTDRDSLQQAQLVHCQS